MIMIGTTLGATRFITATTTIEAETCAAELTATGAVIVPATTKGIGLQAGTPASVAENPTVPVQQPGLLKETKRLLGDTLNPAVRAVCARAPSAATTMAVRHRAIHHAEAPASAAVDLTAALAAITNRGIFMFVIV